jgi:chemotaxis protein histidine kinase CheA
VRVDTGIGESARDVLTHLVRNAIDHGIEPPLCGSREARTRKAPSRCAPRRTATRS